MLLGRADKLAKPIRKLAEILNLPNVQLAMLLGPIGPEAPGRHKDDRVFAAAFANRAWIDQLRSQLIQPAAGRAHNRLGKDLVSCLLADMVTDRGFEVGYRLLYPGGGSLAETCTLYSLPVSRRTHCQLKQGWYPRIGARYLARRRWHVDRPHLVDIGATGIADNRFYAGAKYTSEWCNKYLSNPFTRMSYFCSMCARSAFAIFIVIGSPTGRNPLRIRQIAVSAAFAAGLAAVPLATAKAQYYYPPPCSPFPLSWPFCVAGAAVATAATIVIAPFIALAGPPYYYYGYYWRPRHHHARRHYAHYYYGPR